jgi:hypothetical protein
LLIELVELHPVPLDGLLDQGDVGREVNGQLLCYAAEYVEDFMHELSLTDLRLHYLDQLVHYLSYMLPEGGTLLESIDESDYLNVQL